jgi:hypothetical protein
MQKLPFKDLYIKGFNLETAFFCRHFSVYILYILQKDKSNNDIFVGMKLGTRAFIRRKQIDLNPYRHFFSFEMHG